MNAIIQQRTSAIDFALAEFKRLNLVARKQIKLLEIREIELKTSSAGHYEFGGYHFELSVKNTTPCNGNKYYSIVCGFGSMGYFEIKNLLSRPDRKDLDRWFSKAFDLHQENSDRAYTRHERSMFTANS